MWNSFATSCWRASLQHNSSSSRPPLHAKSLSLKLNDCQPFSCIDFWGPESKQTWPPKKRSACGSFHTFERLINFRSVMLLAAVSPSHSMGLFLMVVLGSWQWYVASHQNSVQQFDYHVDFWSVKFYPYTVPGLDPVFALVGGKRVSPTLA